ncbi:hypothetical protein BRCON_1294 [Candidatus Sumerlaea chitinivorans]|uniref:Uncharacterized protein n=1 Tax=Sumerlaea chitinivorans TaxID=2250252 RepID=A0A2Z4Y4D8_SUMC1|nr:hypothetical protein BRCON_1294 [Candidatus Sumerlaea chitinivorans]
MHRVKPHIREITIHDRRRNALSGVFRPFIEKPLRVESAS